jgi:hypothetical protein
VFGSTGWLFADLMVAIAMAFLVANTVGARSPHHKPHPPRPKKTVCSKPALNSKKPVRVQLTINPGGLISNLPSAQATVRQQVRQKPGLATKRAGFVIIYTGNAETSEYALTVDTAIARVLSGLGHQNFVFQKAVYLDEQLIGSAPTSSQLAVYLFEPQTCTTVPAT